jgi:hypothetical protein
MMVVLDDSRTLDPLLDDGCTVNSSTVSHRLTASALHRRQLLTPSPIFEFADPSALARAS